MMRCRVLLVDDHAIVSEGVAALLGEGDDIVVSGVCRSADHALACLDRMPIEVVITDISMPDMSGIELTRRIRERWPDIKIIALTMHAEPPFVREMFRTGASAYLLKECMHDQLREAVRVVCSGGKYASEGVPKSVLESTGESSMDGGPFQELTPRECQVLRMIAEGDTTRAIGDKLGISLKTVESHRSNISAKLDLHNVADLTRYAIREGLIPL